MPAIALPVKESLSWLIKVVTTPRDIEYKMCQSAGTRDIKRKENIFMMLFALRHHMM